MSVDPAVMQQLAQFFAQQMQEFATTITQNQSMQMHEIIKQMQQGSAKPATSKIDDKYYKKMDTFNGEASWRDWAFQFKSATKMAQQEGYELLEWAEKEQDTIEDELDLKGASTEISSAIFSLLGTMVKGEPLQILYNSNFSGVEAWRKLTKRYSPTTPMRGMQLMMATINPGKAKRTEDISGFIDKWETKVLALSRDFKETLSEKMRAAILISMLPPELQNTLVQQADKITDYKTTKDKIIGTVEAKLALKDPDSMDVDAVRPPEEQTPYPYVQEHDHCEHLDIDAMGKGGFQCYR